MTEARPSAAVLRQWVIDDLSHVFALRAVDPTGFVLEREDELVRVEISADEIDAYMTRIEDSAFDAMGIEPRWRSSLSLVVVHVLEEVAMAEPDQRVIVDDLVVRRDPPA